MGKLKRTKKFAAVKRILNPKDTRLKNTTEKQIEEEKSKQIEKPKETYNTQLGPPYYIILDTNFINFSLKNRMEIVQSMMDCLYAKYCVLAELEKLGQKYKMALKTAKDPRFMRLPCSHAGTYADDCIHKCFIVATCDKDLRRRIRKIPGVPIMYVQSHKFAIERMPDALGGSK